MEHETAYIEDIIFMNKQNIPWSDVERYLKKYIGSTYIIAETGDVIKIAGDFPDEYTGSKYTKSLRGSVAKAKANASQVIGKMIVIATNKRWLENKEQKHKKDAPKGWYRYDSYFAIPVKSSEEDKERVNVYKATLVVRSSLEGLFIYDIVNIKKEASKPLEPK